MLVGDSVSRYQFMALLAALGRAGRPVTCSAVAQPALDNRSAPAGRAQYVDLMSRDPYGGAPLDWTRYPRGPTPHSDLCTLRIKPDEQHGWLVAENRDRGEALVYVWERET